VPTGAASTLADAYERLRHDALMAPTRGGSLRGLALLMRRGMAAWMQACATAAATVAVPLASSNGAHMPPSVQREVIDVLAAMSLRTAMEGKT
jgi:hypothetical protein